MSSSKDYNSQIDKAKLFIKLFLVRLRNLFRLKEMWHEDSEVCDRCGSCYKLVPQWTDDKWIELQGNKGGLLCFDCFVTIAQEKHIKITYKDITELWVFNSGKESGGCFSIIPFNPEGKRLWG